MGVWNWIVGTLSGSESREERAAQCPESIDGDPAVSTLEAPESSDIQGEPDVWWAPEGETHTEPPPPTHPDLSTEARALENALISQFDGHDLSIPTIPRVPEQVLRRLRSRNCDFGKIAHEIAEDQVIAAAVIRLANSPIYGGMQKITALRPAVNRLGSNALRTLMMHHSLRAATFSGRGEDQQLAGLLWNRALASACIMRILSRFTGIDEDEAYLIGLLHDIGNVVVLREAQKQQKVLRYRIDVETFEYVCFECHQEFGELIADAWQLPAKLQVLVSSHHAHPEPDAPHRTEQLQVQLTDMINALLGYAPWVPYDLLATRTVADLRLPERGDFVSFLTGLPDEIQQDMSSF